VLVAVLLVVTKKMKEKREVVMWPGTKISGRNFQFFRQRMLNCVVSSENN
jgi:hypothetical protein